ncbi:MAG: hypothetical protein IJD40_11240 [Lachnospiraceae bacterium]|nr:hypothetical protein [Lachnospiraceae bacterium]
MKYNFYYDESEHSRSIGFKTITADNFYDNFITVIVGWKEENEPKLQEKYFNFEQKYINRHPNGELKSYTLKNKQLRYGFASTTNENINLLEDFFTLFTDDVYIYISTFSKVEYIVNQLFRDYKNNFLFDINLLKYSIIKALVIYKPLELVETIYNNPQKIVIEMKKFFEDRIEKNNNNPILKQSENLAFEQIILLLDELKPVDCIDWNYTPPFVGFHHFLNEKSIYEYSLIIDREGEDQKTVVAAKEAGLINVDDEKSDNHFGIRMADILAGTLGKLMKSLYSAMHPANNDIVQKTILPNKWFILSEDQLNLYKKLHHIICKLNNAWYKSFAGLYADDLICLCSLLNFMNHYSNTQEIITNLEMQGEYYNAFACQALTEDYLKKSNNIIQNLME